MEQSQWDALFMLGGMFGFLAMICYGIAWLQSHPTRKPFPYYD